MSYQILGASILAACVIVTPLVAGEWGNAVMHADEWISECDCGGVVGNVGMIDSFTDGGAVTNGKRTTGAVGAEWLGTQYDLCSHEQVSADVWVRHTYARSTGTPFTRHNVHVTVTSTLTTTGSASQWRTWDQQWWWDTNATITENAPTFQSFHSGSGQWVDYGLVFDPDHNTQAAGGAADASGSSSLTAGLGNRNGDTRGVGATIDDDTLVRAQVSYAVTGGPCSGDNCDVSEQHKLDITFETQWQ